MSSLFKPDNTPFTFQGGHPQHCEVSVVSSREMKPIKLRGAYALLGASLACMSAGILLTAFIRSAGFMLIVVAFYLTLSLLTLAVFNYVTQRDE
jgi:hypothetical protein